MTDAGGTRAPRWAATLLALVAGGVVALGPATPTASAEGAGSCDGVWVVVDARELGGPLTTRCAPGDPSSGLKALEGAGHAYTFVPRVPGMVCTVDQRPDPCNRAPDDAYWSYWHAEAGGQWTYASRGAGARDPDPGTVEGWAFGAGEQPGTAPPDAPADDGSSASPDEDGEPADASGDGTTRTGGAESSGGSGSSEASAGSSDSSASASSDTSDPSGDDAGTEPSNSGAGDADAAAAAPADGDDGDPPDEGAEEQEPDEAGSAERLGAGARAADVLAGRAAEADATADTDAGPERETADEVAVGEPGDARGAWTGAATGTALAGALAGAAALRARRRTSPDG